MHGKYWQGNHAVPFAVHANWTHKWKMLSEIYTRLTKFFVLLAAWFLETAFVCGNQCVCVCMCVSVWETRHLYSSWIVLSKFRNNSQYQQNCNYWIRTFSLLIVYVKNQFVHNDNRGKMTDLNTQLCLLHVYLVIPNLKLNIHTYISSYVCTR